MDNVKCEMDNVRWIMGNGRGEMGEGKCEMGGEKGGGEMKKTLSIVPSVLVQLSYIND